MSIIHRITGVMMFIAIPVLVFHLDQSLIDESGFMASKAFMHSPLGILLLFGLMWGLMHHLLAGVRYLLLDVDVGIDKPTARLSAWMVTLVAPLLGMLLIWGLL